MAPILPLLLSLLIAQEAGAAEPATPAPVSAEQEFPVPPGAPDDDYGLVAWCYGALDGHMRLYEKVLPEVERIETEIAKIPGAPPADMNAYKEQRDAGRDTLKLFRASMEAAEKASPKPISPYGAEQLKRGSTVWFSIRDSKDKKYLAREWMSWGLPGRCLPTAQKLQAKSSLFGQALSYNAKPATQPAAPAADLIGAAVDDAQGANQPQAEPATPPAEAAGELRGPQ